MVLKLIQNTTKSWAGVLGMVVFGILSMYLLVGIISPRIEAECADKSAFKIIDIEMKGYTADEVYSILENYGEKGRWWYIVAEIIDLFPYIWGYTAIVCAIMCVSLRSAGVSERVARYLLWIPLVGAAADYVENGLLFKFVLDYPTRHDNLVPLCSSLTKAKFALLFVAFGIAVAALVARALRPIFAKDEKKIR